ncbi:putative calcium-binding protein CML27 [Zea mays]|uniref:Putative calcium-binding protein CML27 n=1 Tax=Zea mays TaxID=4577 RepID=A0A1D6L4V1_MAIZE|nr:putative calcium-binding protein CML27 [Zea mays]ONM09395.1 putative calcium-binding protein CML27 [Zea mays]
MTVTWRPDSDPRRCRRRAHAGSTSGPPPGCGPPRRAGTVAARRGGRSSTASARPSIPPPRACTQACLSSGNMPRSSGWSRRRHRSTS